MNTGALLHTLQQQVNQLASAIADAPASAVMQPRFDDRLFNTRDPRLSHCQSEVENNLQLLSQAVEKRAQQQVAFLAERIVAQIEALQRELATLPVRERNVFNVKVEQDIYQTLARHQDYERRLVAMRRDKESLLSRQTTLSEQQRLQKNLPRWRAA